MPFAYAGVDVALLTKRAKRVRSEGPRDRVVRVLRPGMQAWSADREQSCLAASNPSTSIAVLPCLCTIRPVNESDGCRLLESRFSASGCVIVNNYPMEIAGARVVLDGYDPQKCIGYEFITAEAGDRDEFTPAVVAELEARMSRGELFILLIDERDALTEESLEFAGGRFLAALKERGFLP